MCRLILDQASIRGLRHIVPQSALRPTFSPDFDCDPMKLDAEATLDTHPRAYNESAIQFMDATAELLSTRSPAEVSLSDISKRAGLNSELIRYYFGSKEGLLMAVFERDADHAMLGLSHLMEMPLSAEKKLKIHISGIANAHFRSPYMYRLIRHMTQNKSSPSSNRVNKIYVEPMIEAY